MSPVVWPGFTAVTLRINELKRYVQSAAPASPRDLADRIHAARIAMPTVDDQRDVDINDVTVHAAVCRSGMPWQTTWLTEVQVEYR